MSGNNSVLSKAVVSFLRFGRGVRLDVLTILAEYAYKHKTKNKERQNITLTIFKVRLV